MTDDLTFKDRKAAFCWYTDNGGLRKQASFYEVVKTTDGKRVSRFAVSEMLRTEQEKIRPQQQDENARTDLANRREQAETEKAEADARKARFAADEAERQSSDRWMLKEEAFAHMAALVGTLRDSLRHHFHLGQGMLVHLAGGDHARAPEMYEGVEEIIAKSFNELAAGGRVEVMFEREE